MVELREYNNILDDGRFGKTFETRVRVFLSPKTRVGRCKEYKKPDHWMRVGGKTIYIEMKTGCGKLLYDVEKIGEPMDYVNNVLPGADYVVYSPKPDEAIDDIGTEAWVATRNEFIAFLTSYNRPMLKWNEHNGKVNVALQSFNSKKKEEYLWDWIAGLPNLKEWRDTIRA